jgi:hypothetical protein
MATWSTLTFTCVEPKQKTSLPQLLYHIKDDDEFDTLFGANAGTDNGDDYHMGTISDEVIQCSLCLEQVKFDASKPYGNNRQCNDCCGNGKRIMERCQKNSQLKTWWKSMSKEEKQQWYKKNKEANAGKIGTYQRREFELPTYTETDNQGDHQYDDDIDMWIPFEIFWKKKTIAGFKGDVIEQMCAPVFKPG